MRRLVMYIVLNKDLGTVAQAMETVANLSHRVTSIKEHGYIARQWKACGGVVVLLKSGDLEVLVPLMKGPVVSDMIPAGIATIAYNDEVDYLKDLKLW